MSSRTGSPPACREVSAIRRSDRRDAAAQTPAPRRRAARTLRCSPGRVRLTRPGANQVPWLAPIPFGKITGGTGRRGLVHLGDRRRAAAAGIDRIEDVAPEPAAARCRVRPRARRAGARCRCRCAAASHPGLRPLMDPQHVGRVRPEGRSTRVRAPRASRPDPCAAQACRGQVGHVSQREISSSYGHEGAHGTAARQSGGRQAVVAGLLAEVACTGGELGFRDGRDGAERHDLAVRMVDRGPRWPARVSKTNT